MIHYKQLSLLFLIIPIGICQIEAQLLRKQQQQQVSPIGHDEGLLMPAQRNNNKYLRTAANAPIAHGFHGGARHATARYAKKNSTTSARDSTVRHHASTGRLRGPIVVSLQAATTTAANNNKASKMAPKGASRIVSPSFEMIEPVFS